jgi:hypothetical protein
VNYHSLCDKDIFANDINAQEAFKAIVDDFTPKNWKASCATNIGKSAFPENAEQAGYAAS